MKVLKVEEGEGGSNELPKRGVEVPKRGVEVPKRGVEVPKRWGATYFKEGWSTERGWST